ncbi:hypothetical protein SLS62_005639 [Diatrype stigma]|uniref:Uncharacterized protein n=1 Tax=Diatrype stigma TaxID=117547 RepID=A0AAN9UNP6_9PEZI
MGFSSFYDHETPQSIYTADTPNIEENHPLHCLKDSFLEVVMVAYKRAADQHLPQSRPPAVSSESQATTEGSFQSADTDNAYGTETSGHPRKRGRGSDSSSVTTTAVMGANNEKTTQKTNPGNRRRNQDRKLWLACPYAKKDPVRYRHCYSFFLGRVRDQGVTQRNPLQPGPLVDGLQ